MRKLLLLLALPFAAHAQINWKNYSTSFQGDGKEGSQPTLVTAIPWGSKTPEQRDPLDRRRAAPSLNFCNVFNAH